MYLRAVQRAGAAPARAAAQRSLFAYGPAKCVSSQVEDSIAAERNRQLDQLIMIPSESICFPEVARTMESEFANIYAEGQGMLRLSRLPTFLAEDSDMFHAWHNRLSDGRFYCGCIEADRVELLAKLNVAKALALLPGSPPASDIHVNVQALSGGPANLGIYTALLKSGDCILSLDLTHGGHLSHGSPYNVSGKQYKAVHYGVDVKAPSAQRKLDYDNIRKLAKEHKPRIIVAGSSAYPYDLEWATLRSIADEVGALLHADVCHLAGMIVGGQLNNPLPFADVMMFTTHKTMMGPRGAVIVTKCAEIARKVDNAIFPGLQGGPHMNSIAGIARLFEIVLQNRDMFCQLQARVKHNAAVFGRALQDEGLTLEYGGTNTHLVLLDLKPLKVNGGGSHDGETASRLLENVGLICNKNTLPGDRSSSDATGLRFGVPWLTQRGIDDAGLKSIARITRELLASATAFKVWAPSGDERARARVPFEQLTKSREEVLQVARALPYPARSSTAPSSAVVLASYPVVGDRTGLLIRGEKAKLSLSQSVSCDVLALKEGQTAHGYLYSPDGKVVDDVVVANLGFKPNTPGVANGEEHYAVFPHTAKAEAVKSWFEALSDGYVLLQSGDPYMKVEGPYVVESLGTAAAQQFADKLKTGPVGDHLIDTSKPFFVGRSAVTAGKASALPTWEYKAEGGLKKTVLHGWHAQAKAKVIPFGGWDMPVEYPSGIFAEHAAVRAAAGLFDVSHMSALEVSGPNALPFLETVFANAASRLMDNEAQYSYMLRETGLALDDLYVYRINREKFMVVVNAGNFEQDWSWLTAVNEGRVSIDLKNPGAKLPKTTLRNLRDVGEESLIDLAFQGPLTLPLLVELAASDEERATLRAGKLNDIHHIHVGGIPVRAARTGYTGEEIGYELFVHPTHAQALWEMLLDKGKSRGVRAIGLGARDSLRTEAGFPLFGHELEGPANLSLTEADYGFVSRFHRPYYVGRQAYIDRLSPRRQRLVRVTGQGRRMVRPGHAILDASGKAVGSVTSAAFVDNGFNFYALAAVDNKFNPQSGEKIRSYRTTPDKMDATVDPNKVVELNVLTRFPTATEKANWRNLYAKFLKQ